MSELGEHLPLKDKLPTKLTRNYFVVRLPMVKEEEEAVGLIENDIEEDIPLTVCLISEDCKLIKEGDDVIMNPRNFLNPYSAFKMNDGYAYYIYNEADVIGIW